MISASVRPHYIAMVDDLLRFYIDEGSKLSDSQLFIQVCVRFGDRLLTEVCPFIDIGPLANVGECAIGAIEVMREAMGRVVKGAQTVAKNGGNEPRGEP